MEAKAHLKYLRMSPRKVKIVLDLIRNKPVGLAMGILKNTSKAASEHLIKLLKSVVSNAVNVHNMNLSDLYVAECFACPGPIARRMQPVSKGRGHRILKRSSHVTIVLRDAEKEDEDGAKSKS